MDWKYLCGYGMITESSRTDKFFFEITVRGMNRNMEYEYLLRRYTTVTFRPACRQEVPLSIRGFSLPSEYIEFISQHDGASLVFDASVPDLDDMRHIELFSLREIIDGTSYQDPYGCWLGSELTMREDFPNTRLGVRTTANGTPYSDAPALFEQFYRDNLIIGYAWVYWDEPTRWIALLGIDKTGRFIISDDKHIEYRLPVAWSGASLQGLLEHARDSV